MLNCDSKQLKIFLRKIDERFQWYNKETRDQIKRILLWRFWDNPTTPSECKKNVEDLLSIISQWNIWDYVMGILWLGEIRLSKVNNIVSKNYLEVPQFLNEVRSFIVENYKYFDMVVYRYQKSKNMLKYFAWNKELSMKITLNDIHDDTFKNERLAISSKNNEVITSNISSLDDIKWSLATIRLDIVNSQKPDEILESYVFSFPLKDDIDNKINISELNHEILQLKKIFNRGCLWTILKSKIENINSKYIDYLTNSFSKCYVLDLPKRHKYSVIYIDIDMFKEINDNFWHQKWDEVLIETVRLLKTCIRENDKLVRIWWDEFVILVQTNDEKDLNAITERINNTFLESKFVLDNWTDFIKIWLSMWKSVYENSKTLKQTIAEADIDMYNSKSAEGQVLRLRRQIELLPIETQGQLLFDINAKEVKLA